MRIGFTGKFFGIAVALALLGHLGRNRLSADELRDWLWESWRFVKQIFPLLVIGVFVVGMARVVIRPEWIEAVAGTNSVAGNLAGVAFGVFMYFPTLVEVPIARMFLDLGMHRGPLLAYLMADPELSLQSILIISAIIGKAKAWTYVATRRALQRHRRPDLRGLGRRHLAVLAGPGGGRLHRVARRAARRGEPALLSVDRRLTMLTIKILGPGCANCSRPERIAP